MTLTELRYVVAVATEKHFGRAAEACFVTQPTLSVGLRKLEEELGVTLFERERSGVRITPVGEQVLAHARRVLEEVDALRTTAAAGGDPLRGPLRLGAIYTIGPYLLPHIVPRLRRHAPDMPLVIEEGLTGELREKLKRGELDVILIALPFTEPGVITWPIYEEPFVVLAPMGHRWQGRKTLRPEELSEENLLLLGAGHCLRDQVLEHCPDCADPGARALRQTVAGTSLETVRQMVASGLGISVLPETSVEGAVKAGRGGPISIPFRGNGPRRVVALAWRKRFPRSEAIEVLRRSILEGHLRGVTYLDHEPKVDA